REGMPFASMIHPRSPMWTGLAEQPVDASAPAPAVTLAGADGWRLTTATRGDYFDTGAIQHLSHVILDLAQFYDVDDAGNPGGDADFTERIRYLFGASPGHPEPVPAFRPAGGADGTRRNGHVAALRRSSRGPDG